MKLDLPGAVTVTGALLAVICTVIEKNIPAAVVGVLLLAAFWVIELRSSAPLAPVRILQRPAATQTMELTGIHLALTVNVAVKLVSVVLIWFGLRLRGDAARQRLPHRRRSKPTRNGPRARTED